MLLELRLRGRSTGIEFPPAKGAWVTTFRDGLIVHLKLYMSQSEALEAVGLSEQAMSQENVELTRAYFDLIARASSKDFDTETTISKMAEFWDPELEWDASEAPFDLSQVGRGIEAGRQWCRDWFTAWEALQFEYEVVDAGNRVVTLLDLRMRGRSTGIEVVLREHAWVTTFRDGLMVRNKLYMDRSEALKAAGLKE